MKTLHIEGKTEFGLLCGAYRSVVNKWLSVRIKNIDPRYAFKLEDASPFLARWIMLGEGKIKK